MSLNIDPNIERDLTELAGLQNVSVNALLREFTAEQKRYWKERAEDMARLENVKQNGGVTQGEMKVRFDELRDAARAKL